MGEMLVELSAARGVRPGFAFYANGSYPNAVALPGTELHADFLAGYHLGLQPREFGPDELVALGRAWEDLGDSDYTSVLDHGTREERIAAMEHGFEQGRRLVIVDQAAEAGALYLNA